MVVYIVFLPVYWYRICIQALKDCLVNPSKSISLVDISVLNPLRKDPLLVPRGCLSSKINIEQFFRWCRPCIQTREISQFRPFTFIINSCYRYLLKVQDFVRIVKKIITNQKKWFAEINLRFFSETQLDYHIDWSREIWIKNKEILTIFRTCDAESYSQEKADHLSPKTFSGHFVLFLTHTGFERHFSIFSFRPITLNTERPLFKNRFDRHCSDFDLTSLLQQEKDFG